VLNFRPRRPREHSNRVAWEYLLWPAWSHRVVAPRVRDRQLNMFQRAVLGLCRTGIQGFETIGEKLAVHSDLAALILIELADLGYIDKHGCPTEKGIQVLSEDTIEAHDLVAGYVFQDPWSGDLWPRFVEQLDYCDLEWEENGFPRLLLGSAGRPKRQGAFMVLPDGKAGVSRPSSASVVAAIAGHRKGIRFADNLAEWDDNFDDAGFIPSVVHIDRVSFIEEEPSPVFLMTYVYLSDGAAGSSDWYACDPFGLGANVRFRRQIEQVMQTTPPLYNVINRLVGRGLHEGLDDQKRWVEQLRRSAELEVEKLLTVNIRTHMAFDRIVDMEFAYQEGNLMGRDCPKSKIQGALRNCLKVIEALFGDVSTRCPLGDIWKRVYTNRVDRKSGARYLAQQQDQKLLRATYEIAAFSVGFKKPIPNSLLGVKPGQVRSVAERGQYWRLRPMVMANILAAQVDETHPLRSVAKDAPNLLQDIEEIARQGGKAGHANSEPTTLDDAEATVKRTYAVIAVLLGLGFLANAETTNLNGENHGKG
jgi:hypothetical protein